MAAILGRQTRDEGRLPERLEAVEDIERRKAAIFGVDEEDAPLGIDTDLVDIDIAGGLGVAYDRQ